MKKHLLALAALLAITTAVIERGSGFTVDEGSYAIQAKALHDGTWTAPWPFLEADPEGDHLPYGSLASDGELVVHARQAAWPAVLSLAGRIPPEEVGLRLVPLAGVVAAAAAAFALGRRLGGDAVAPWAFWITVASPLLPNGEMLWAHSPAIALAGLAALALVELLQPSPRRLWAAVLAVALGAGVMIRSDALLFAAAAVAVLGVVALVRRSAPLIAATALAGAATLAAHLLDRRWVTAILGTDQPSRIRTRDYDGGSWISGRLRSTTTTLIGGATDDPAATILGVLVVGLVGAAVFEILRPKPRLRVDVLLAGALVALLARWLVTPDAAIPGLFAAWPVGLLAVISVVRDSDTKVRVLTAVAVSFAILVLLTQDDSGGGLQWGGRYLSALIVPVAVVAAAALGHERLRAPSVRRVLAALLATGMVMGVAITDGIRARNARAMDRIDALGSDVVLTGGPYLGRLDWTRWPERCWVAVADDLPAAIEVLRGSGVERFAYIGIEVDDLAEEGLAAEPDRPGSLIGTVALVGEPGGAGERCPR